MAWTLARKVGTFLLIFVLVTQTSIIFYSNKFSPPAVASSLPSSYLSSSSPFTTFSPPPPSSSLPLSLASLLGGTSLSDEQIARLYEPKDLALLSKGMTMEEMELCRTAAGGPRGGMYECAGDSTCLKCQPEWALTIGSTMQREYYDPALRQTRKHDWEQVFNRARNLASSSNANLKRAEYKEEEEGAGAVWVIVTNEDYLEMVLNWACSVEAHGIPFILRTVFGATTSKAHRLLHSFGLLSIDLTKWYSVDEHATNGKKLQGIRAAKVLNILMMLDLTVIFKRRVLFVDADIVFFKDPIPFLEHYHLNANYDVQTCPALRWDAGGTANTGFIYMRPTHNSIVLLESMLALAPVLLRVDDQSAWNTVLRHFKLRQVAWHNIPRGLCCDLHTANQLKENRDVMLVAHFVAGEKMKRIHALAQYYFTPSCSFHAPAMREVVIADSPPPPPPRS